MERVKICMEIGLYIHRSKGVDDLRCSSMHSVKIEIARPSGQFLVSFASTEFQTPE